MPINTKSLDNRIKVEGKDATNRFPDERRNFIRDICVEISASQRYEWLKETFDLTVPATKTDWINLPQSFHQDGAVFYNGKNITYLSETDYAMDNYRFTTAEPYGFYRLRYNQTAGLFQISLVNGPEAGQTVKVLVKKYLTQPEDFPDFMEEVLKMGALARFLAMQEGDDLELAIDSRNEYIRLALQHDKVGNNNLVQEPRRTKTINELYERETYNRYGR
jgi:hypothetical protein